MGVPYRIVVDTTTSEVLRGGHVDFANDGAFNAATEEIFDHGSTSKGAPSWEETLYRHGAGDYQSTPP